MTAKEVAGLFELIELYLVASLKRNLLRHEKEEQKEGFSWSAWQAEALRGIRRFRSDNRIIMSDYYDTITGETEAMLRDQYAEGGAEGFFHINDPKLETLICEMQTIEQDVKKAALRTMDDVYRQTIYQASAFANTGTMTIQQATDFATKQFLEHGIQCIRYKNGRMVNIDTYVEMALRTNATRARLLSDAKQREHLGIDTVLVSQYGACSPTCLPWQGRVYIDDFFGTFNGRTTATCGISGYDGKPYPLISVAIKNGLFHPNCRHTVTTWIPGISTMPKPLDEESVRRAYDLERKQRTLESRLRSTKRLAAGTIDPDAAKQYARQTHTLQKQLRALMDANPDVLRRDYWREQTHGVIDTSTNIRGSGGKYDFSNGKTIRRQLESIDPSDTEKKNQLADWFCRSFASSPYENMLVVTGDGEVYFMTDSAAKAVDCSFLGDKLRGSYNIHTHPAESTQYSFSTDVDIPAAFADGTAVMEAVDYKYRYRFEVPQGVTWDDWDATRKQVKDELGKIMELQEIGLEDYEENAQHILIQETCNRLGINCYMRKVIE